MLYISHGEDFLFTSFFFKKIKKIFKQIVAKMYIQNWEQDNLKEKIRSFVEGKEIFTGILTWIPCLIFTTIFSCTLRTCTLSENFVDLQTSSCLLIELWPVFSVCWVEEIFRSLDFFSFRWAAFVYFKNLGRIH